MMTHGTTLTRNAVGALIAASLVSVLLIDHALHDLLPGSDRASTRGATGNNAEYMPNLAQVDLKLFGISAVTTDNQSYSIGDTVYSFSIQSISMVFTLALAMEELGADKVFERIGSEPTDRYVADRLDYNLFSPRSVGLQ
jgi:hypothetical protein